MPQNLTPVYDLHGTISRGGKAWFPYRSISRLFFYSGGCFVYSVGTKYPTYLRSFDVVRYVTSMELVTAQLPVYSPVPTYVSQGPHQGAPIQELCSKSLNSLPEQSCMGGVMLMWLVETISTSVSFHTQSPSHAHPGLRRISALINCNAQSPVN